MSWEDVPTFTGAPEKEKHTVRPILLSNLSTHCKEVTCCTEGDWLVTKGLEQTLPLHASHPSMVCSNCRGLHSHLFQQNRATEWQYCSLLQQWPTANRENGRRRAKAAPCFKVSGNKEGRYQLYFSSSCSHHEDHTSTGQGTPAAESSSTLSLTAPENICGEL